jgi:hypothetical protein
VDADARRAQLRRAHRPAQRRLASTDARGTQRDRRRQQQPAGADSAGALRQRNNRRRNNNNDNNARSSPLPEDDDGHADDRPRRRRNAAANNDDNDNNNNNNNNGDNNDDDDNQDEEGDNGGDGGGGDDADSAVPYQRINRVAKSFVAARGAHKVQVRRAWGKDATQRLIQLIEDDDYGTSWAKIEKLHDPLLEGRGQVALKDKARNIKVDFLKCVVPLPTSLPLCAPNYLHSPIFTSNSTPLPIPTFTTTTQGRRKPQIGLWSMFSFHTHPPPFFRFSFRPAQRNNGLPLTRLSNPSRAHIELPVNFELVRLNRNQIRTLKELGIDYEQ